MAFSAFWRSRRVPPRMDHIGVAAVLLVVLAGPLGGGATLMRLAVALDAEIELAARSPGARRAVALVKRALPATTEKRTARALPRVRAPAPAADTMDPEFAPALSADMAPTYLSFAPNGIGSENFDPFPAGNILGVASAPSDLLAGLPMGGGFGPGLGGGLGPFNPTPTGPETGTEPVDGAVPEPQVWAMLIAGFGLIGERLRRVQRRTSVHAH